MMSYHKPVLLQNCIEGLQIKPNGTYVDVTFGGGGHSLEILKHLDRGRLIAFDQDGDAAKNATEDERLIFVPHNFKHLKRFLKLHGIKSIDGLLADLGVSSHQIDTAERGFSTRFDGPLDMRMSSNEEKSAFDVINTYSAEQLQLVFGEYGEVRNSRSLAQEIERQRRGGKIETVGQLKEIAVSKAKGKVNKYLAQVFQAIRIEVNDEMDVLKEMLLQSGDVMSDGGRLVVMSYHSLEDRIVKRYMKYGTFDREPEKDEFGRFSTPFKMLTKKPIEAVEDEVEENPRARSAKLRIAEKVKLAT